MNVICESTQGKNISIGRNNAGKSNIVGDLDLVLKGTAPAWAKTEREINR
jgi:AAA15 family ATPase/GTPase